MIAAETQSAPRNPNHLLFLSDLSVSAMVILVLLITDN
jgi:hypothetical protein